MWKIDHSMLFLRSQVKSYNFCDLLVILIIFSVNLLLPELINGRFIYP